MNFVKKVLNVSTHLSGNSINIVTYSISKWNGPKYYIQSWMHGGEITYWILEKLSKILKDSDFKGTVIIVPIANPVSRMQRNYYSTNGKFDNYDGRDRNRNFPWDKNWKLWERIAHALFSLASDADFVVDLHTSRASFPFSIFSWRSNKEFVESFGLEFNYYVWEEEPHNYTWSLSWSFLSSPNITLECGSHDSFEEENIEKSLNALLRSLTKYLGLNYKILPSSNLVRYYSKINTYNAVTWGFVSFQKKVGDNYTKWDVLYTIHTPYNLWKKQNILALENWIVQKLSPTHIYWPGDEVLQTIPNDWFIKI